MVVLSKDAGEMPFLTRYVISLTFKVIFGPTENKFDYPILPHHVGQNRKMKVLQDP